MQRIITEKIGEKVIIVLQQDLDASDQRLLRRLQGTRQGGQVNIWVDCASLKCIKSLGFCHFVNQLLLLKVYEVNITLLNLSRQQRQILQLLRVEPFFSVVPDFEEAYHLVQAS
ncbi:hypothetical protein [Rufibacter aurantiacus]|uniref:hypothetical protein n=1 Tax=Rufibacter aurantiacus TaxID=2817374 RepID=UPI001B31126A|nr:hypothetical protein [Rufibacter aurantiacus]